MQWFVTFIREFAMTFTTLALYRRLVVAFVAPFALFWTLFTVSGNQMEHLLSNPMAQKYRVAFVGDSSALSIKQNLELNSAFTIYTNIPTDSLESFIKSDSIDMAVVAPPRMDTMLAHLQAAPIRILYNSQARGQGLRMLRDGLRIYERQVIQDRLQTWNVPVAVAVPLNVELVDVVSVTEQLQLAIQILLQLVGSLVGMIILAIGLWSSKHIGIHLFTREYASATQPQGATQADAGAIFMGKFATLCIVTVSSLVLIIVGLWVSLNISYSDHATMLVQSLANILTDVVLIKMLLHSLPLSIALAALWAWLMGRFEKAYWATRWGSVIYILILIISMLSVVLVSFDTTLVYAVPFGNILGVTNGILTNSWTWGNMLLAHGATILVILFLLMVGKRHFKIKS